MAAEFFDELVKVISKTTKELGKTTKEIGARAEQTVETQKIRNKIAGEERIIAKIKEDIGDVIYRRHSDGDGIDNELSSLCQEIDQHYLKIREFKDSAANLKGQKICPSCEREVDITVSFCPYCGTPCPTPEPVQNVEGEAVQDEETADGSSGTEEAQTKDESEEAQSEESAGDAKEENTEEPAQEQPVERQPEESVEEEPVEEQPGQETPIEEKIEE